METKLGQKVYSQVQHQRVNNVEIIKYLPDKMYACEL